jgi:damage-control phosphatase, subfamily I
MRMDRECLPCILNQVLRVCTCLELDGATANAVLQRAMEHAAAIDYRTVLAPQYSQRLYDLVQEITGQADPYQALKREHNARIDSQAGHFRRLIDASPDPLATAAHYALLGNIIDYGSTLAFDIESLFSGGHLPAIDVNDMQDLKADLAAAHTLLYILDNAGEAVFDRLLIETIRRVHPGIAVTAAVRSAPAINDVTAADAVQAGLDRVARIVPSGSILAGTIVNACTPEFQDLFAAADVVISKGQGNFETLDGETRPIYFLFKAKCQPVARHLGLPLGALILAQRGSLPDHG